jgi:hypothetical protein
MQESLVIPAKAGISRHRRIWMPAFVGMTAWGTM